MIPEHESVTEICLKKIVEQNEAIIGLLRELAGKDSAKIDDKKIISDKVGSLTKRERQVLDLIMEGMLNKQMAYNLAISLSTIEAHRSSIMKKMEAKNVAELTKKYMIYQSSNKY